MNQQANRKNISIVLLRPKYAGNVGAVARAAKNMGIGSITVVGAAALDREEMLKRSTHLAADVLEDIKYFDDVASALADFQYIVGTTSRVGKARGPFETPWKIADSVAAVSRKNKVALLFGPEDTGLANNELRYCQAVVTIPASRTFKSLNLSHAVMIMCYEIFTAALPETEALPAKWACTEELENMYKQIKELLAEIGFLHPENPDYWMMHLRRYFNRTGLTSREVKIIRGICRQLSWSERHKTT
ncbi:MAG TPA: RNA methyltransferase [Smithellaceae bacterium]|nr:RNA methyltransferase [Smithellaceae bacterium]